MQDVQTQNGNTDKCCGKKGGQRGQRRGGCGSRHHDAGVQAASNPLEILQQRFARGEIETAEFEQKRRLITNA